MRHQTASETLLIIERMTRQMTVTEPNKLSRKPPIGACPPGCVEHYVGHDADERWHNHSTAPRYVTGESATTAHEVVSLGAWMEVREHLGGVEVDVVGVVEKDGPGQAELSAAQLRQLALHLLAVAGQVEAFSTSVVLPVRVSAVSENTGLLPVEASTAAISGRKVTLTAGMENLMLEPCDARRLGEALIRMAG